MDNTQTPSEHTIETLAAAFGDLKDQFAALQLENAALKAQTKIAAGEPSKKLTIPTELVTVDGKSYKWQVAHFHLPGEVSEYYTSEEAATDPEVIKKILDIKGQGLLKLQA